MSSYILLMNYTQQGIQNIKDSPGRLDAARRQLESLGGKVKDFYLTMGGYDVAAVIEAPDDRTVAQFVLSAGAHGNVRTTTLKAFPEAEFRQIVETLP
jgi:uncharacterized protein with GYD domain